MKSATDAVAAFITQHPRAAIRDAQAYAKAEYQHEELAAVFVRAWLDRTNAAGEFSREVDRR